MRRDSFGNVPEEDVLCRVGLRNELCPDRLACEGRMVGRSGEVGFGLVVRYWEWEEAVSIARLDTVSIYNKFRGEGLQWVLLPHSLLSQHRC